MIAYLSRSGMLRLFAVRVGGIEMEVRRDGSSGLTLWIFAMVDLESGSCGQSDPSRRRQKPQTKLRFRERLTNQLNCSKLVFANELSAGGELTELQLFRDYCFYCVQPPFCQRPVQSRSTQ